MKTFDKKKLKFWFLKLFATFFKLNKIREVKQIKGKFQISTKGH